MTDLSPPTGSYDTPSCPTSPSSSYGFSDHTSAPGSPKLEREDLKSSLVLPSKWRSTVDVTYPHVVEKAVQRAVEEVIKRLSTTAVTTTMALIMKDFSMERDESQIKTSAVQMATVLSESLAQVTTKEAMRISLGKHLREVIDHYYFPLDEDNIRECVNLNLEFLCSIVPLWAITQTMREIQKTVENELEKRQTVPWKRWVSPSVREVLARYRVEPIGIAQQQLDIYKAFSAFRQGSPEDPPWTPVMNQAGPANPIGSKSVASLWSEPPSPTFLSENGTTHLSDPPPTDSGYGSASYAKTMADQNAAMENLQQNFSHSGGAHTTTSVYSASVASDLPAARDQRYISEMSSELCRSLGAQQLSEQKLRNIADMLPEMLKAFALKLGYRAQTQAHRDVSYFVQKHRKLIQEDFQEMFSPNESDDLDNDRALFQAFAIDRFLGESIIDITAPENECTRSTLIQRQRQSAWPTDMSSQPTETEHSESEGDDEVTSSLPAPGPYREFIVNSPAYRWLLATLQRESSLSRASPDIMQRIREVVIATFPSERRISRRLPSSEHKMILQLDWDPVGFVKEQQYDESPDKALSNAITLTGSCDDAQALTSLGYLSQTWPATGESVMHLLCEAVRNQRGLIASSRFSDGAEVEVRLDCSNVIVTALGTAESLVEVVQQFAWLGAALRSSPFPADVAECTPTVTSLRQGFEGITDVREPWQLHSIFCRVSFDMQKSKRSPDCQPGQCWHSMFRNPVMVQGYPISAKCERSLGLEVPLNMMAGLVGTNQIVTFDDKSFVKGFSAMLVAVRLTKDLLVWHYRYSEKGGRVSYNDHGAQAQKTDGNRVSDVSTMRHVVGWCADCIYNAGASDAAYSVRRTGLPRPHAGCILEKVSLTGGKFITGGMSFAVGTKDTPIHLERNGYIPMLRWIATNNVVLWDEEDKRGWLVNGTSALLHLVRASLKHYREDDFSSACLFDASKMEDQMDHRPNSAVKVLISERNRDLEIYPGARERFDQEELANTNEMGRDAKNSKKRGYFLFEDLVKQHSKNLEQIIDHQRRAESQDGMKMRMRMRKHLEGWDFIDVATDHDPHARVATLQALGYGWVDFVRSIGSVILFGRGFGDIIQPAECASKMCSNWTRLPMYRYYLAVSMADLNRIMEKHGDPSSIPPRPVHELLWHSPNGVISACPCQSRGGWASNAAQQHHDPVQAFYQQHHDPVQVFYPQICELVLRTRLRGPDRMEPTGAVVFGHNVSWRYRWTDTADGTFLEKGEPSSSSSPSQSSASSRGRPPGLRATHLAPWSASIVSRGSSATASGTGRDAESSVGATSTTGITSPQSRGTSPLSLSGSNFAYASSSGQHSEGTDDDQRARARRREKRRMQNQC